LSPGADPTHNSGDRLKEDWQGTSARENTSSSAVSNISAMNDRLASAQVSNNGGFVEIQSNYDNRYFMR